MTLDDLKHKLQQLHSYRISDKAAKRTVVIMAVIVIVAVILVTVFIALGENEHLPPSSAPSAPTVSASVDAEAPPDANMAEIIDEVLYYTDDEGIRIQVSPEDTKVDDRFVLTKDNTIIYGTLFPVYNRDNGVYSDVIHEVFEYNIDGGETKTLIEQHRWFRISTEENLFVSRDVNGINGFAVSPNERYIAYSQGKDKTKIYDRDTGEIIPADLSPQSSGAYFIWSDDSKLFAHGGFSNSGDNIMNSIYRVRKSGLKLIYETNYSYIATSSDYRFVSNYGFAGFLHNVPVILRQLRGVPDQYNVSLPTDSPPEKYKDEMQLILYRIDYRDKLVKFYSHTSDNDALKADISGEQIYELNGSTISIFSITDQFELELEREVNIAEDLDVNLANAYSSDDRLYVYGRNDSSCEKATYRLAIDLNTGEANCEN